MADDLEIVIKVIDQASGELSKIRGSAEDAGSGIAQAAKVGFGALGVAADVAVVASVKAAESFQTMVANIRGNTTMTAADAEQMGNAIKQMAVESGASLEQLGQGWMHIANFGFQAADAQKILTAAMQSAVAAGGDVGATANVLAAAMKEFGIGADQASNAMDVLHEAAARGNMTLEQLVDSAGKALSTAANLGVSLTDAGAALSTMTQHGFDAAQAATQLTGILTHIVTPSQAAEAELRKLSQTTGIDLVTDFSAAGLRAKGLSGVMEDVTKATAGNTDEILKLIPALRGGQGAMVLAGNGAADFAANVKALQEAQANGSITTDAYHAKQQTLGNELDRLGATVHVAAIDIGTALIPAISGAVEAVTPLIAAISQWIEQHPQLSAGILLVVGALGTLVGGLALLQFAFGPVIGIWGNLLGLMTGTAGSAGAATAAMGAQAGAAQVDAASVNALVAALLAQAEADGLVAEAAMNAAAADAAQAAAGGEMATSMAVGAAAGVGLLGSMGPVGLAIDAVAIAAMIALPHLGLFSSGEKEAGDNAETARGKITGLADAIKQASGPAQQEADALKQQGLAADQLLSIATTKMSQYEAAHQQVIQVDGQAGRQVMDTSSTIFQQAAAWQVWYDVAQKATAAMKGQASAQADLQPKALAEAAAATFDADAQTRLSDAIDKAAKGGAQAIPFFNQLEEAHKFAALSADDQNAALADLQNTIDTGKGKAQAAAQSQMDLDLAIRTMGGSALDASIQYQQLQDALKSNDLSAPQQLRDIDQLLNNINIDATTAGNAILDMFKRPTTEMLNAKADLAGYKDTQAQLQAQLADMPPTLQDVANAQKQVDDLWAKGQTNTTQYATALQNRATVTAAAYHTEGQAATDNAAATQQQIDATGSLITQTQAHVTAMQAHTDALAASTQAAEGNSVSQQQQTDEYNKAVPIINALAQAQQGAATATQGASQTTNAAYNATRDAHTDMTSTIQTNTANVQTATQNAATTTQGASAQMAQANDAVGKSFDLMNQGAQTAMTAMLQLVANGILAVELLGIPAARGAGVAIGAALDQGIEAGVQAEAGNVAAAAAHVVTQVINAARAAAQISSPSRSTWQQIGVPLGEGVSGGFADWMSSQGTAQMDQATRNALQHQQDMIAAAKEQISAGEMQTRDITSFANSITGAVKPDALSVSQGTLAGDTAGRSNALAQMLQAQAALQQADAQVKADADALAAATTKDEYDRIKAQLDADKQVQQSASTTYQQASSEYQRYVQAVATDNQALRQQAKDIAQFDVNTAAQAAEEKVRQIKGVSAAQVQAADAQITQAQRQIVADRQLYGEYVAAAQAAYQQIQALQADLMDAEQQGDADRAIADANQIQALHDYISQLNDGTQAIVDDYKRQTDAINNVTTATQNATQATQQQAAAVHAVSSAASTGTGGGSRGGGTPGIGPGGIYGQRSAFFVRLPDGQDVITSGAGDAFRQMEQAEGNAMQASLNAAIAAQHSQSTGVIQAGPVSVQVIVGGANPGSSLNVAVV